MKERWKLKRADRIKAGDIFWRNNLAWSVLDVKFSVATGRSLAISAVCGDAKMVVGPSVNDYLPVLLSGRHATPPEAPTPPPSRIICEGGSPRNLRPGRPVLGAPPVVPTPPPLRYEKQPDSVWQTLKDWLNGR